MRVMNHNVYVNECKSPECHEIQIIERGLKFKIVIIKDEKDITL